MATHTCHYTLVFIYLLIPPPLLLSLPCWSPSLPQIVFPASVCLTSLPRLVLHSLSLSPLILSALKFTCRFCIRISPSSRSQRTTLSLQYMLRVWLAQFLNLFNDITPPEPTPCHRDCLFAGKKSAELCLEGDSEGCYHLLSWLWRGL